MLFKESTRVGQQSPALFVSTLLASMLALLVSGCSSGILSSSEETSDRIARQHQWQKLTLPTKSFVLRGFLRAPQYRSKQLAVYIEEDGYAWINEYTISPDPTPYEPLVLKLAVRHPAGAALYLACPC